MWRDRMVVCVLVSISGWSTATLTARQAAPAPVSVGSPDNVTRLAIQRAAAGAAARLARSECRRVLTDFVNESDMTLTDALEASGRTPEEAFNLLRFYDDRAARQCRTRGTLAFTQVGSRLIRICGPSFRDQYSRDSAVVELLVIHEFLHALGLGENPPTPGAITQQVSNRCGGS